MKSMFFSDKKVTFRAASQGGSLERVKAWSMERDMRRVLVIEDDAGTAEQVVDCLRAGLRDLL